MRNPAWLIRWEAARNDIYAKAQLSANNSGQAQYIYAVKDPDNPNHSGLETMRRDHIWWVLEAKIEPQPERQNAGFARVERIV